jgi:hypothetical protein
MHMSTRARWLLDEVKKAGAVSLEALEATAEAKYSGSVTYTERQEIVATAADLHVAETRGDPVPPPRRPTTPKESGMDRKQLTSEETRAVAIEYFRGHPGASARECYEYIETLGAPSVSKSTFVNDTGSRIRRELGLRKGRAAPRSREPAKKRAARAKKRAAKSPTQKPAPEKASASVTDDSADFTAGVVQGPDGRDRIVIDTPGGSLTAREEGGGLWFAEFRGAIEGDLLNAMIVDLVKPFMMELEVAPS